MTKNRTIKMIQKSTPTMEGAGVHLNRVFGFSNEELFDPFLLFDDFRSDIPEHYLKGFPWHPHRGIETITYVLRGDVEHGDSLGNKGVISSGDIQWMTAGSGIIHQEMPKGNKQGEMHGFQLWANLPAKDKMMYPRYLDIPATQIPCVELDDGTAIKVIAGTVNGICGPVTDIMIDPEYLDCTVPAGNTFRHKVEPDYTAFIYVIGGNGTVEAQSVTDGILVLFDKGDEIAVKAGDVPLQFLLISGKPLKEPIAWRGPIVMNTQDELDVAFLEYNEGTFTKHE
jgi:redox-sensitive bicupin YhaK (pirin superfamily)